MPYASVALELTLSTCSRLQPPPWHAHRLRGRQLRPRRRPTARGSPGAGMLPRLLPLGRLLLGPPHRRARLPLHHGAPPATPRSSCGASSWAQRCSGARMRRGMSGWLAWWRELQRRTWQWRGGGEVAATAGLRPGAQPCTCAALPGRLAIMLQLWNNRRDLASGTGRCSPKHDTCMARAGSRELSLLTPAKNTLQVRRSSTHPVARRCSTACSCALVAACAAVSAALVPPVSFRCRMRRRRASPGRRHSQARTRAAIAPALLLGPF